MLQGRNIPMLNEEEGRKETKIKLPVSLCLSDCLAVCLFNKCLATRRPYKVAPSNGCIDV